LIQDTDNYTFDVEFDQTIKFIRLVPDSEGKNGNTNDIELYDAAQMFICGLSVKHRNLSLKHPRAGSIGNHIGADVGNIKANLYVTHYTKLNLKWYEELSKNTAFRDVDNAIIYKMYGEFINLLFNTLKNNHKSIVQLLKFCLSIDDRLQYLVVFDKCISIMEKIKLTKCRKYRIRKEPNRLVITIGDIIIYMRIHTASSNITKTLSLKYDVTCDNIDKLYQML
jgi:hypothetical protein